MYICTRDIPDFHQTQASVTADLAPAFHVRLGLIRAVLLRERARLQTTLHLLVSSVNCPAVQHSFRIFASVIVV
jgi:hypothetical protein